MTAAELRALADRVERAKGADTALDADIMLAKHPELASWDCVTYPGGKHPFFADRSDPEGANVVSPLAFTASLDAALTLVPEGCDWLARSDHIEGGYGHVTLQGISPNELPHASLGQAYAATPALALTAAALRARAEEAPHE